MDTEPIPPVDNNAIAIDHHHAGRTQEEVRVNEVVRGINKHVRPRELPLVAGTRPHFIDDHLCGIDAVLYDAVLIEVFTIGTCNGEGRAIGGAILHVQCMGFGHVDRDPIEIVKMTGYPFHHDR